MTSTRRADQVACPHCPVGIAQQEPDLHLTGDCGCPCHRADTGLGREPVYLSHPGDCPADLPADHASGAYARCLDADSPTTPAKGPR